MFKPERKKVLVTQSCPTLCDPMDCSPLGSSVHGILQARILEWVAISFSRGSSSPRDWTWVSHTADSSVQPLSHVRLFATPWTAACQASLSNTNSRSPPKPMSIVSMMPSNHLILCCPLLPSIFPSIRVFSNESALLIRWPKYWSFSFNISPSSEHPGLITFRMNWVDLLAVQGTLKSSPTPQFKSINSLALSFLYSPTLTSIPDYWKNHSLD